MALFRAAARYYYGLARRFRGREPAVDARRRIEITAAPFRVLRTELQATMLPNDDCHSGGKEGRPGKEDQGRSVKASRSGVSNNGYLYQSHKRGLHDFYGIVYHARLVNQKRRPRFRYHARAAHIGQHLGGTATDCRTVGHWRKSCSLRARATSKKLVHATTG